MILDDDFMMLTREAFSKMRLVLEGAITLLEDEICPMYRQIREISELSAIRAFDDIGTALYMLRQHVYQLQEAHHNATHQPANTQNPNQ